MRDDVMTYHPYRVVIVTLDQHAAGPAARVSERLAGDFPGLEISVHAAAEWSECPDALSETKKAVAQANLIIANMLFLEGHVAAIYDDLLARREDCDGILGMIAETSIVKLTKIGDLDMADAAFVHAGALDDPLITRVDHLLEIGVRQLHRRHALAPARDGGVGLGHRCSPPRDRSLRA